MSHKLPNYLRTHRKRAGFSQDEVAFLLGSTSGSKVSRYEKRVRRPTLVTALAYGALFRVPVQELFAGMYNQVEQRLARRASQLADQLHRGKQDRWTARKLAALEAVTRRDQQAQRS